MPGSVASGTHCIYVPRYREYFFNHVSPPPPVGLGLLIIDATRSHNDTPHLVGLLCTSDQPDAETTT